VSNVSLGNATLSVNAACRLVVGNLGATGQDGVSQVSLPANTHQVATGFVEPNFGPSSQIGDREDITVHANVPGGVYYRLTVENMGNDTVQVRPDFSPIGATLYTIMVFNGPSITSVVRHLANATMMTGECVQTEIN